MGVSERMGLFAILKKGCDLYAKRFKDIILAALIIYTPIALLDLFPIKVDFEAFGFTQIIMDAVPPEYVSYVDMNMLAEFALMYLIGTFLAPLGVMAVAFISYNTLEEKPCGFKEGLELSFKSWGKFIVTSIFRAIIYFASFIIVLLLAYDLGIVAAALLPLVPLLILTVCFAFSDYCVIIEGKWGWSALKRSTHMVSTNRIWLQVAWYTLVLFSIEFSIIVLTGGVPFLGSLISFCLASVVVCMQCCWFHNIKQITDAQAKL